MCHLPRTGAILTQCLPAAGVPLLIQTSFVECARRAKASKRELVQHQGYILIVEPDDLIRELLERWLSEAGYRVVIRSSGEMQTSEPGDLPQLIIADVPVPRSTDKLIKQLRDMYAGPILIVSARLRRGASDGVARRLGVRKLLAKPFTRSELLMAVTQAMNADGD